jgi:hypothetical protein
MSDDEGIAVVSAMATSATSSSSPGLGMASGAAYPNGSLGSTMTGSVGFIIANWIQAISSL